MSSVSQAVDFTEIERQLKTTGAEGWIHGSVPSEGLFAFTVRDPQNFFDYAIMSLVAYDPDLVKTLSSFTRHDKVRIRGHFMGSNPSPQKHIFVEAAESVQNYKSPVPAPPYHHAPEIPAELKTKTSALFLVHGVFSDGHIFVVEYKDTVIPIFVKNENLTKSLNRNDVVRLKFEVQDYPSEPVHLRLIESDPQAVEVVDSVLAKHGHDAKNIEGALVMFPKSPEIKFNVFAVEELLPEGLRRQYTLINFEDPAVFKGIRETLQAAWDRHPNGFVNGRNKLVSTAVRVRVSGVFNEVDPNQANVQIVLDSLKSLTVLEVPSSP